MRNLITSNGGSGTVDAHDFLARAEVLAACGYTVLISDYFEYYRLAAYLSRHTDRQLGVVMGARSLRELFDEHFYQNLDGGILESFGRLFKNDLKLFEYLIDRGNIEQLDNFNREYLHIFSRDILDKIRNGDPSWEGMVPAGVGDVIKRNAFFQYRPPIAASG
jgi:hypothetical protein